MHYLDLEKCIVDFTEYVRSAVASHGTSKLPVNAVPAPSSSVVGG